MLITPEYLEQNRELHETDRRFGANGHKWADRVEHYFVLSRAFDLLDYGCGKGTLVEQLSARFPDRIRGYDPVTRPEAPKTADFVTCMDVLEHIEPDCLEAVLDHLASLLLVAGLFVISLVPSDKPLLDGRNAHLIVKPTEWWLARLRKYFDTIMVPVYAESKEGRELAVIVRPKRPAPKKRWEGESVAILACGPSLLTTAPPAIAHTMPAIAINDAGLLFPDCDTFLTGDDHFLRKHPEIFEVFAGSRMVSTVPDIVAPHGRIDGPKLEIWKHDRLESVSHEPKTLAGKLTSVALALNYALHEGASEALLFGVDLKPGPAGERRAGDDAKDTADALARYEKHAAVLDGQSVELGRSGLRVINCNPDSALECYPKMSLEAYRQAKAFGQWASPYAGSEPLTILLWKWGDEFDNSHVDRMKSMLRRHLHRPYRVVLFSDQRYEADGHAWHPLPKTPLDDAGKCLRRLYAFLPEMREYVGNRFAWIDLDCVLVDDVTPIFNRIESFVISGVERGPQPYNGSLVMMDTGIFPNVYHNFDGMQWRRRRQQMHYGGSDQAWIAIELGPLMPTWTHEDGLFSFRDDVVPHGGVLPEGARIVQMNGKLKYDEAFTSQAEWIEEHWR